MKPVKKNLEENPHLAPSAFKLAGILNLLPLYSLALTLFLVPLCPDEKLNRIKLIVLGVGLIVSCVLWALKKIFEENLTIYKTPLDVPLLLYFITALFYFKSSQNPSVAANEFQRMFFSIGAFFITLQICSEKESFQKIKFLLLSWFGGLFLVAVYGILQRSGGIGSLMVPQTDRVFATFGNPIFFAGFLILTLPILMAFCLMTKPIFLRILLVAVFFLGVLSLFYTKTRAAFLSFFISNLLFYLFLERMQGWQWTRKSWGWKKSILIFFLILGAFHLILNSVSSNYQTIFKKIESSVRLSRALDADQTHTLLWKDVLKMWRANKWLGTGYGTFHVEFSRYASEDLKRMWPQQQKLINDAHNEYLQILAETGLIGFTVFLFLFIIFYWKSFKFLRSSFETANPDKERAVLYLGFFIGISALLIQNFFSVDMRFVISAAYIFLTMGLACASFSKPFVFSWGLGIKKKIFKFLWISMILLVTGVAGFIPKSHSFFLLGIYELSPSENRSWSWKKTPAKGPGLLPLLLRPYLSQKQLSQTPDFFDQKTLNSVQTIQDLESLIREAPEVWQYWEKLGYFYAKEIQRKDPSGKKLIDSLMVNKAISAYLKAYELNPKAEGPPNNLGNIYFTIHHRQEAIEWWKKAIVTNPDKTDPRLNLGIAYYYEGKIKESVEQLEEVLKREPKNERAIVLLKQMVE
ncbi:MAG: O-antigen ligase family protein [Elusimicrobia bacterium]|nr:O-antigen ligase family protein [Elusimicrobiota bacterium]